MDLAALQKKQQNSQRDRVVSTVSKGRRGEYRRRLSEEVSAAHDDLRLLGQLCERPVATLDAQVQHAEHDQLQHRLGREQDC